jgi:sterol desaturase/sphingolipid hydroxylase (fatty acid hydroxylase superfamily)
MHDRRTRPTPLQTAEAWWAFLARVIAFMLGAGVLMWQTIGEEHAQEILVGASLVLMVPATIAVLRGLLPPSEGGGDRGRS